MKELLKQEESMVPGMFFNLRKALLPLMDDASYDAMAAVVARVEQQSKSSRDLIRTNGSSKQTVVGQSSTSSSSTEPSTLNSGSALGKRPAEEGSNRENMTTKAKMETTGININANTGDLTLDVSAAQCKDDYCVPCYELM